MFSWNRVTYSLSYQMYHNLISWTFNEWMFSLSVVFFLMMSYNVQVAEQEINLFICILRMFFFVNVNNTRAKVIYNWLEFFFSMWNYIPFKIPFARSLYIYSIRSCTILTKKFSNMVYYAAPRSWYTIFNKKFAKF